MSNSKYPYKPAKYKEGWRCYVEYYIYNSNTRKLERKRDTSPNSIKDPEERRAHAEKLVKHYNELLKQGARIDESVHEEEPETTLKAGMEYYKKIVKKKNRESTARNYTDRIDELKDFLQKENPRLLDKDISKIKSSDIIPYFDYITLRMNPETGFHTYNNNKRALSAFFGFFSKRLKKVNPISEIEPMKETGTGKNIPFPKEMVPEILEYIKDADPPLYRFVLIMFYTFARPSEICQIKFRFINLDANHIFIPGNISKNTKSGYVTISKPLEILLKDMIERFKPSPEDYLFSQFYVKRKSHPKSIRSGNPGAIAIKKNRMYIRHRKILQDLKLYEGTGYTLYSWKHTGVVMHYESGVTIKKLQSQLRHSNLQETDKYLKGLGLYKNEEIREKSPDIRI